jgi:hypothetical protein
MSVLTHLQKIGSDLVLSPAEKISIGTSILTLETRLNNYFDNIQEKFVFGSYDREVILPRKNDENSDVDYMVVFRDGSDKKPQTLLTRLKTFVELKYSKSEIYQSSPTVVLELNHIKFELVPAYKDYWGTLYIPAPSSDYQDWISSNPKKMKEDLINKNTNNGYNIKPLVRILKYWNVKNGKVYSSYELEKYIVGNVYIFCTSLKDYFYSAVATLSEYNLPDYKKTKVQRLKQKIEAAKAHERNNHPEDAEKAIKDVIPEL